jgi:hypothetical protein
MAAFLGLAFLLSAYGPSSAENWGSMCKTGGIPCALVEDCDLDDEYTFNDDYCEESFANQYCDNGAPNYMCIFFGRRSCGGKLSCLTGAPSLPDANGIPPAPCLDAGVCSTMYYPGA